jgi:hypothetical protein
VEDGATVKAGAKLFKLKLTGMYIIMWKQLGFSVSFIWCLGLQISVCGMGVAVDK